MIKKGEKVFLRHLRHSDIDTLLLWENDRDLWEVSDTVKVYSRDDMEQFVHSDQDLFLQKQIRYMICRNSDESCLGCIDLFDFDPKHLRAGVGILVYQKAHRNLGFGSEALALLIDHSRRKLQLKQLYCNVLEKNEQSLKLFEKQKFQPIGVKREWRKIGGTWKNEILMQLILQ